MKTNFLKKFYLKVLKYDLINIYNFNNSSKLPELKTLIINFKTNKIKKVFFGLLAIELIINQKSPLITNQKWNVLLKINKGVVTAYKLTIKKNNQFIFYTKIILEIFASLDLFQKLKIKKTFNTFQVQNVLNFSELKNHLNCFQLVPRLNFTMITKSKTKKQFRFLFKSLQNLNK